MLYVRDLDVCQGMFIEITSVADNGRVHVGCDGDGGERVKAHRETMASV